MKNINYYLFIIVITISSCDKEDGIVNIPDNPEDKIPIVFTNEIMDLTVYSATISGGLNDDKGELIEEIGVVIDTFPNPTISNNIFSAIVELDSNNEFVQEVKSFESETNYYYRTYAKNSFGIGYGNEVVFLSKFDKHYPLIAYLNGQEEVDAFGQHNYTSVNGLNLEGQINDLSPLSSIVYTVNGIDIEETVGLKNLIGLSNLEIVGTRSANGIYIKNNTDLVNLEGLSSLRQINGWLFLEGNDNFENFNGVENLELINLGDLRIQESKNLVNFSGLQNVWGIGGDLFISNCPKLTDLNFLTNVSIVYSIYLQKCDLVQNLDPLINIQSANSVTVRNNYELNSIEGLGSLQSINTYLWIYNNASLSNFCPLRSALEASQIIDIRIYDNLENPSIEDIINDC